MRRDAGVYLHDILEAIRRIQEYAGKDQAAFPISGQERRKPIGAETTLMPRPYSSDEL